MILKLRVQPRSSRDALVPWQEDEWKLYLTAPAVGGRANQACIEFLAQLLRIPKSRVRLLSGEKSRRKLIALDGVTSNQLRASLHAAARP